VFKGWATSPTATSPDFDATTVYSTAANRTIYAVWGTEALRFVIKTTVAGETFAIPTEGTDTASSHANYTWDVDWGDDSGIENHSGISQQDLSPGISHTYASAGTYEIVITPHGAPVPAPFGWARAFGFISDLDEASLAEENSDKVIQVLEMPAAGFMESVTSTGNGFLLGTWAGCTSLEQVVVPDISAWPVTTIGDGFMFGTWGGCTSLEQVIVPDTSNWAVTSVGDFFLARTWTACTSLTQAVVPDTSNWAVTSVGVAFLAETWLECTSLTQAAVPDTSNWTVPSVGGAFLAETWAGCTSLEQAVVPDTSGWSVASVDYNFLVSAWEGCTSLTQAVVPDTSSWAVTSVGDSFLTHAWANCTSLAQAVVPDTSGWAVISVGDRFLDSTWYNCTSLKDISSIKLSNSFKDANGLYTNGTNFYRTFYLESADPSATGGPPSFYDDTLITALGTPPFSRQTFTNRTGMDGYTDLVDNNWA
jgi:hypothetical protein